MKGILMVAVLLVVLVGLSLVALAAPQALSLTWWTVGGGGQTASQGGGYTLGGTAGQPDAGALSGGGYTLGGGFWRCGALAEGASYLIYLPVVMRGS
jgi:hypothetical protein